MYSEEIKNKVKACLEENMSVKKISNECSVSERTIYRWQETFVHEASVKQLEKDYEKFKYLLHISNEDEAVKICMININHSKFINYLLIYYIRKGKYNTAVMFLKYLKLEKEDFILTICRITQLVNSKQLENIISEFPEYDLTVMKVVDYLVSIGNFAKAKEICGKFSSNQIYIKKIKEINSILTYDESYKELCLKNQDSIFFQLNLVKHYLKNDFINNVDYIEKIYLNFKENKEDDLSASIFAEYLFIVGRYDELVERYMFSNNTLVKYYIVKALILKGDYEQAKSIARSNKQNELIQKIISYVYLIEGNFSEVIALYQDNYIKQKSFFHFKYLANKNHKFIKDNMIDSIYYYQNKEIVDYLILDKNYKQALDVACMSLDEPDIVFSILPVFMELNMKNRINQLLLSYSNNEVVLNKINEILRNYPVNESKNCLITEINEGLISLDELNLRLQFVVSVDALVYKLAYADKNGMDNSEILVLVDSCLEKFNYKSLEHVILTNVKTKLQEDCGFFDTSFYTNILNLYYGAQNHVKMGGYQRTLKSLDK